VKQSLDAKNSSMVTAKNVLKNAMPAPILNFIASTDLPALSGSIAGKLLKQGEEPQAKIRIALKKKPSVPISLCSLCAPW
jgi:hypothetical protein